MKAFLCATTAIAALLVVSAQAADCGQLRSYGTIPLTQIAGHATEFVPVEINGTSKLMVLDTGADVTTLSNRVANELKLVPTRSPDTKIYDAAGIPSDQSITAPLKIGAIRGDKIKFMMGTPSLEDFGDPRVAGLLGADVLDKFDIAIDFGAHTLTMLDQNHCEGVAVYWPERPIAVIPFKVVQGIALQSVRAEYQRPIDEPSARMHRPGENLAAGGSHIVFPVILDGKEVMAQLATGAPVSMLEKSKAERSFDIVLDSPEAPGANNANGSSAWKHRFKTLSLAGIEVANLELQIIPDKIATRVNNWSSGTMLDQKTFSQPPVPPLLLGMDVLKHLHIYISYKEKKLYVTPASQPIPAPKT